MKRAFDLALASVLILFAAMPMLLTAILIRWKMGSPVLFKQRRLGYAERVFTIYKFRTMLNACDKQGNPLPDSQRLTKLGAFLRKSSLDELPQLWNIVKGDMSFIGPRPLFVEYLPYYTAEEKLRHSVRPGITGLAQVSGRNSLLWDDRLRLDVHYVKNYSFWLDMKIVGLTLVKVVNRDGVEVVPGIKQGTLIQCRKLKE